MEEKYEVSWIISDLLNELRGRMPKETEFILEKALSTSLIATLKGALLTMENIKVNKQGEGDPYCEF